MLDDGAGRARWVGETEAVAGTGLVMWWLLGCQNKTVPGCRHQLQVISPSCDRNEVVTSGLPLVPSLQYCVLRRHGPLGAQPGSQAWGLVGWSQPPLRRNPKSTAILAVPNPCHHFQNSPYLIAASKERRTANKKKKKSCPAYTTPYKIASLVMFISTGV